jgi:hypothetical protein
MRQGVVLTLFAFLAVGSLNAGETFPFDGVWKLNVEKSHISPYDITIETVEGGKIRFGDLVTVLNATEASEGQNSSNVVSVVSTDPESCKVTFVKDGKPVSVTTFTSHGDKVVSKVKVYRTEGKTGEQAVKFERLSGGPGFLGKWRASDAAADLPKTLKITGDGSTSITLDFPDEHVSFTGAFDGKDYPMQPSNGEVVQLMSFERIGERAFRTNRRVQGSAVFSTDVFTLSENGTTLTDTKAAKGRAPSEVVYEKK